MIYVVYHSSLSCVRKALLCKIFSNLCKMRVLNPVPDNWHPGHRSPVLGTALGSVWLSVWQDKPEQRDPKPVKMSEAKVVMEKGLKTSNWFGGFTGGKRKIWEGESWGLVTGHGKTNHLSLKWAMLNPLENLWWFEWTNTHTYLK